MTLEARAGVEVLHLPPLDLTEARQIAESICARYHRTLEPLVMDALLARSGPTGPAWGNNNTLRLVLAVEVLNLVDGDDFAHAKRSYKGAPADQLRALMLDKVAELPTEILGLYGTSFDRAEELFGRDLTRAVPIRVKLVSLSPHPTMRRLGGVVGTGRARCAAQAYPR
jgi:hypothetical protein